MLFTCLQLLSHFLKLHLKANKVLRGKLYSLLWLIAVIKREILSHCQFLWPGDFLLLSLMKESNFFHLERLTCSLPAPFPSHMTKVCSSYGLFQTPLFIISLSLLLPLLLLLPLCEGVLEHRLREEVVKLIVKWLRLEASVRNLAQRQCTYWCVLCCVPFLLFSTHCTVLHPPSPPDHRTSH